MKYFVLILITLFSNICLASKSSINYVLVKKSEEKMYLLSERKIVKEYDVAFASIPKGHKQQEGDERTPEGKYVLDYKKVDSSYHRAIHISYPKEEDIERAKVAGVNPGGQIMIHGQRNGFGWLSWITQWFNWTDGCIAVTNSEIDEIWLLVNAGTPIEIQP